MSFFRLNRPDPKQDRWSQLLYEHIRLAFIGKVDDTTTFTLAANTATTTVSDARIGAASKLFFTPTTATAAAEMDNLWTKSTATGSAILVHSNTADTDKIVNCLIRG